MPKYTFECPNCGEKLEKIVSIDTKNYICPICKDIMSRNLPNIGGQEVRELIDSYTGVTWHQDQKEKMNKRNVENYWEKEVPKLIQKYSLLTCLEQGWLVYNEKGELTIGKPPSKQ